MKNAEKPLNSFEKAKEHEKSTFAQNVNIGYTNRNELIYLYQQALRLSGEDTPESLQNIKEEESYYEDNIRSMISKNPKLHLMLQKQDLSKATFENITKDRNKYITKLYANDIYQFRFDNGTIMANPKLKELATMKLSLLYHINKNDSEQEFLNSVINFVGYDNITSFDETRLKAIYSKYK